MYYFKSISLVMREKKQTILIYSINFVKEYVKLIVG